MGDNLININDQLKIAVLVVLVSGYLIYEQKPSLLFKDNGEFKHFGLNKDETPFPFFLVVTVIGFTSYYCLLLKEGKYV
tara:strand:+ start:1203 stop:1439 length:237 start_codon:yes stop_codon:yes gene_type:complete